MGADEVPQVPLFETISQLKYEKCARRFLYEVASGQLEAPEYLQSVEVLKSESLEALIGSPELPYSASAKYGAKAKSIAKCQNKFTCPRPDRRSFFSWDSRERKRIFLHSFS